jgi:hypothetical protein
MSDPFVHYFCGFNSPAQKTFSIVRPDRASGLAPDTVTGQPVQATRTVFAGIEPKSCVGRGNAAGTTLSTMGWL